MWGVYTTFLPLSTHDKVQDLNMRRPLRNLANNSSSLPSRYSSGLLQYATNSHVMFPCPTQTALDNSLHGRTFFMCGGDDFTYVHCREVSKNPPCRLHTIRNAQIPAGTDSLPLTSVPVPPSLLVCPTDSIEPRTKTWFPPPTYTAASSDQQQMSQQKPQTRGRRTRRELLPASPLPTRRRSSCASFSAPGTAQGGEIAAFRT